MARLGELAYYGLQSRAARPALAGMGLGIVPAVLGILGAIGQVAGAVAAPALDKFQGRRDEVAQALQASNEAQAWAAAQELKARRTRQLALVGAGVLVAGGVAYVVWRRRRRKKRGRR